MKKPFFISLAVSAVFTLVVILMSCFTYSESISGIEIDGDGKLYGIYNYSYGNFLKKFDEKGSLIKNTALYNAYSDYNTTYLDIAEIYQNSYPSTDSKSFIFVLSEHKSKDKNIITIDKYDSDTNFIETVYTHEIKSGFRSVSFHLQEETGNIVLVSIYDSYSVSSSNSTVVFEYFGDKNNDVLYRYEYIQDKIEVCSAYCYNTGLLFLGDDNNVYFMENALSEPKQISSLADDVILNFNFSSSIISYTELTQTQQEFVNIYSAYDLSDNSSNIEIKTYDNSYKMNPEAEDDIRNAVLSDVQIKRDYLNTYTNGYSFLISGIIHEKNNSNTVAVSEVYLQYGDENPSYTESDTALQVSSSDLVYKKYTEKTLVWTQIILIGAIVFAAVFIASFLVSILVVSVLSVRKVVYKQVLMMVAVSIVLFIPINHLVSVIISDMAYETTIDKLKESLNLLTLSVDADYFAENGLTAEQSHIVKQCTSTFMSENGTSKTGNIDLCHVSRINGEEFITESFDTIAKNVSASYIIGKENAEAIKNLEQGEFFVNRDMRLKSPHIYIAKNIYSTEGKIVGFFGIGIPSDSLKAMAGENSLRIVIIFEILILAVCAIYLIAMSNILKPLKLIKNAMVNISAGKIGETVTVRSNDEFQDIAVSLSEMSLKLKNYFENMNIISKSYERFVPKDFFRFFDKNNVLEVVAGDFAEIPLNYISFTIGGNTESAMEAFSKLNRLYSCATENCGELNGVVRINNNRCVTVMFDQKMNVAIESVLRVLEFMNSDADEKYDVSASIFTSTSVVGVIGNNNSMNCTSVSALNDVQDRVFGVMKELKLSFIGGDEMKESADKNGISIRYIGKLSIFTSNDEDKDSKIYEVIDACQDFQKKVKASTENTFALAVEFFENEEYKKARNMLIEVLRENRDDTVARQYLLITEEKLNATTIGKNKKLEVPV